MDNPTLKLFIEILTKEVGDKRAAEIIAETKLATLDLGQGLGKTSDKTKELGEETEKGAEKLKLFHGEGREMHKVISEITRISPALGEALRVAMHPIGGTIAAAIGLFVLMKEHIAEVEKELDVMAEKAAEPDFLEGIKAKQAVLRSAADAAQDYAAHLKEIATSEHTITAELTAQLALQKAVDEARNAQRSAETSLEQARIKAAVASGRLSPQEGEVASDALKRKAIADEAKAKQSAQDQELKDKQTALGKLNPQADAKTAQELQAKYAAENARRTATEKDYGDDSFYSKAKALNEDEKKALAKLAKTDRYQRAKDAEDAMAKGQGAYSDLEWQGLQQQRQMYGTTEELENDDEEISKTRREKAALAHGRSQWYQDQKTEPEFNAQKIAADEAKKKADESAAAFAKLTTAVADLDATIKATRATENTTVKKKQDAEFYDDAAKLGGGVKKIQEFDRKIAAGNVTPQEADQELKDAQATTRALLAAYREAHNANSEALGLILEELKNQKAATVAFAIEIANLKSQMNVRPQ